MNCCNDYGECNQGRDCPVRKEIYDEREHHMQEFAQKVKDAWTMFVVKCMFYLNVIR